MGMTERFVETPHGRVRYVATGNGRGILLLHGGAQWADLWHEQAELVDRLSPDFRVVAVDRPGHGPRSPSVPARALREQAVVEGHAAVLDAEGLTQVAVWGYSLGGHTALSLATMHPDRSHRPPFAGDTRGNPKFTSLHRTTPTCPRQALVGNLGESGRIVCEGLVVPCIDVVLGAETNDVAMERFAKSSERQRQAGQPNVGRHREVRRFDPCSAPSNRCVMRRPCPSEPRSDRPDRRA